MNNQAVFWSFWDEKHVITRSVVLLASDRLTGPQLRHFAFEEITQALGLAQDSDEFPDSIFFERDADGGIAVIPSPLDLKLLGWFYQHAQSGDNRRTLSKKFEETWR